MNEKIIDRGIIKWQPFDSCFNSNTILKDINHLKERKKFPILSEEQLNLIEEKVWESYNLKLEVNISYYYDGNIKNITGKINGINVNEKKLYLNNIIVYFKQILNIEEL